MVSLIVVVAKVRQAAYRTVFEETQRCKDVAVKLADLHIGVAQALAEVGRSVDAKPEPVGFAVHGRGAARSGYLAGSQVHAAFGEVLVRWLGQLRWFPACAAGWVATTAAPPPIHDTNNLPPFWYNGEWCVLDDSVLNAFVLPRMSALFRTWVRALRGVVGLEFADVGCAVPFAGSGLAGLSVPGRVPLAPLVVDDLLSVTRRRCDVRSLRLPSFW